MQGTDEIEIIVLNLAKTKEVQWNGKAFKNMKNPKMLIIRNAHFSVAPKYLPNSLRVLDWPEYPSSSLPSNFHPDKLVRLDLINSCFIFDEPLKNFMCLKEMNLSNCELIERVPTVSGMPNLTKLNLSGCRKLIEVDNSVGFLGKIELLNASECTKLRTFPNVIESTSLKDLNLSGCSSLESFPETFGIIDYIKNISLGSKIGRWNDLRLVLTNKSLSLQNLLCSSSMVPKIEKLMRRFKNLRKCQGPDQDRMNALVCSKLRSLTVQDCSLIDEYLPAWLGFFPDIKDLYLVSSNVTDEYLVKGLPLFPNLESLHLSDTRITIIPKCIKECHFLSTLHLAHCEQLKEIRGVPPNIKSLDAEGCTALSAQSRSLLLSETIHERGGTDFILPGTRIPEWFDHICGSSLHFWFRNKLPQITLCIVNHDTVKHTFRVLINGMQQAIDTFVGYDTLPAHHISLLDFQASYALENKCGAEYMQDKWNHVEIRTHCGPAVIGVYIHKKRTNTEDVLFTNPNLQERRYPELRKRKRPGKSPIL